MVLTSSICAVAGAAFLFLALVALFWSEAFEAGWLDVVAEICMGLSPLSFIAMIVAMAFE